LAGKSGPPPDVGSYSFIEASLVSQKWLYS
jgi:hypothetical protein